jgi:hypothetical protein
VWCTYGRGLSCFLRFCFCLLHAAWNPWNVRRKKSLSLAHPKSPLQINAMELFNVFSTSPHWGFLVIVQVLVLGCNIGPPTSAQFPVRAAVVSAVRGVLLVTGAPGAPTLAGCIFEMCRPAGFAVTPSFFCFEGLAVCCKQFAPSAQDRTTRQAQKQATPACTFLKVRRFPAIWVGPIRIGLCVLAHKAVRRVAYSPLADVARPSVRF